MKKSSPPAGDGKALSGGSIRTELQGKIIERQWVKPRVGLGEAGVGAVMNTVLRCGRGRDSLGWGNRVDRQKPGGGGQMDTSSSAPAGAGCKQTALLHSLGQQSSLKASVNNILHGEGC